MLDTSAYSRFRQADPRVEDYLAVADAVLLPTIVLGELEAGFVQGRREKENRAVLAEFLSEPWVRVVPVDIDVARRYGAIVGQLRSVGAPIATNDVWIAATTMATGGHLLTFDRDFRHVEGLDCTLLE